MLSWHGPRDMYVPTCCRVHWPHPLGSLVLSWVAMALGPEVTLEVTCVLLPNMFLVGPFWVLGGLGTLGCSLHCAEGCRGLGALGTPARATPSAKAPRSAWPLHLCRELPN